MSRALGFKIYSILKFNNLLISKYLLSIHLRIANAFILIDYYFMAYEKTNWTAREGSGLNRFTKSLEDETTVYLENTPNQVTAEGTPFSPDNMNKIEKGIFQAHEEIQNQVVEIQELKTADENINTRIDDEIQDRQTAIKNEQTARERQINDADANQTQARELQISELRGELQETNHVLEGVHTTSLTGATLTRVLGGTTEIPTNLFAQIAVFMAGKTLIFDEQGTTGVYIENVDSATILVLTKSISPVAALEPTLLGNVELFAELPSTVTEVEELWGRTPRVDDFAQVMADVNFDGLRVEYYITNIDNQGNITWGNPVPLNTADFQIQTSAGDAGKVLVGGATPGTFGDSLSVETEPVENSKNLASSGGLFALLGGAVSGLKTSVKTIIGAINELHEKINSITNKAMFMAAHPVNSIYMTVDPDESTPEQMAAKYGGTWARWGAGRTPVSLDLNDPLFNAVEKTGGSKEVTLTSAQSGVPQHSHPNSLGQNPHAHAGSSSGWWKAPDGNYSNRYCVANGGSEGTTHTIITSGATIDMWINNANNTAQNASQAHDNIQPYIVCYIYKRLT